MEFDVPSLVVAHKGWALFVFVIVIAGSYLSRFIPFGEEKVVWPEYELERKRRLASFMLLDHSGRAEAYLRIYRVTGAERDLIDASAAARLLPPGDRKEELLKAINALSWPIL